MRMYFPDFYKPSWSLKAVICDALHFIPLVHLTLVHFHMSLPASVLRQTHAKLPFVLLSPCLCTPRNDSLGKVIILEGRPPPLDIGVGRKRNASLSVLQFRADNHWVKSSPPVLLNKVLLVHSHAYLHIVYITMTEFSNYDRDSMACKEENLLYLILYRKCLPTSTLVEQF